ncbi:hypothetical protein [Nostoc sp.]|uniref:hypothetical protein n=1 Tax=Nostoc sp. TaxID=1180 RepID=UPI002FFA5ADD
MATNKVSRSEEAVADTRVHQKRWKKRDRSSSDYLAKLLRNVEALALALLELRLRSLTWKDGYKVNQAGKSHAKAQRRTQKSDL